MVSAIICTAFKVNGHNSDWFYATSRTVTVAFETDGSATHYKIIDGLQDTGWLAYNPNPVNYNVQGIQGKQTLKAKLKDAAGNVTDPITRKFYLDLEAPVVQAFKINNGSTETSSLTVSLSAKAFDISPLEYRLKNSAGNWTGYATFVQHWPNETVLTSAWQLSGADEGNKTVYIQFEDEAGLTSSGTDQATIYYNLPPRIFLLQITDPDNPDFPNTYTNSRNVRLAVSFFDLNSPLSIQFCNESGAYSTPVTFTPPLPGPYAPPTQYTYETGWQLSVNDGTKVVKVKITDATGKYTILENNIVLDTVPPSGTVTFTTSETQPVFVVAGKKYVAGTAGLKIVQTVDTASSKNKFTAYGSIETIPWGNYADYFNVNLNYLTYGGSPWLADEGTREVFVNYKDKAGNVSSTPAYDKVNLDRVPPILSFVSPPNKVQALDKISGEATDLTWIPHPTYGYPNKVQVIGGSGIYQAQVRICTEDASVTPHVYWYWASTGAAEKFFWYFASTNADYNDPSVWHQAVLNPTASGTVEWTLADGKPTGFKLPGSVGQSKFKIKIRLYDKVYHEVTASRDVNIDPSLGQVTNIHATPDPASREAYLNITFNVLAQPTPDPTVKVENQAAEYLSYNSGDKKYTYGYAVADFPGISGTKTVSVSGWLYGAPLTGESQVVLDLDAPTGTLKVTGEAVKKDYLSCYARDIHINLSAESNDVGPNGSILISGDITDSFKDKWKSFNDYHYHAITLSAAQGLKNISAIISDEAGNTVPLSTALVLDTQPPALAITAPTNGSYQKIDHITGTVSDPTSGVSNMYLSIFDLTDHTLMGPYVVYFAPPGSFDYDSSSINWLDGHEYLLTCEAADVAGNHSKDTKKVTIDQSGGLIDNIAVAPNPASREALLNITFSNDQLDPSKTLSVTIEGSSRPAVYKIGTNYTFTYEAASYEGEGNELPKTVYVRGHDSVDNEVNGDGSVTFDFIKPTGTMNLVAGDDNPIVTVGGSRYVKRQNVKVAVNSPDAAWVKLSGDVTSSSWLNYTGPAEITANLTDGSGLKTIRVTFRDLALNESAVYSDNLILDPNNPSTAINYPSGASYFNLTSPISGTAQDGDGSGVKTVQIYIKRHDNHYLDAGGGFTTGLKWLNASGQDAWSYAVDTSGWMANPPDGTEYTIGVRASDEVGNRPDNPTTTVTFTLNRQAPVAPTGVTIHRAGSNLVLNWNAVSGTTYNIYRSTSPVITLPAVPYQSNLTINTFSEMLPNNPYYYAVTANGIGGESALSTTVGIYPFLLNVGSNWFSLPLKITNLSLDGLMDHLIADYSAAHPIPPPGETLTLTMFNNKSKQTKNEAAEYDGGWVKDPIVSDQITGGDLSYMIVCGVLQQPFTVYLTGEVPASGAIKANFYHTPSDINWGALPLDQPAVTNSQQLANSIGAKISKIVGDPMTLILRRNPDQQEDTAIFEYTGTNWELSTGAIKPVVVGQPFKVAVKGSTTPSWP